MNDPKEQPLEIPLPDHNIYKGLISASKRTGLPPAVLAYIGITRLLRELKEKGEITVPSMADNETRQDVDAQGKPTRINENYCRYNCSESGKTNVNLL